MAISIDTILNSIELGEIQSFKNMTVVPLLSSIQAETIPKRDYITFEEAIKEKLIEIHELGAGGAVPTLRIINKGERPILIAEGEIVKGGQQDREINISIIIPGIKKDGKQVEIDVPVSCVEQSRWGGTSIHSSAGHRSDVRTRAIRTKGMQSTAFSTREYSSPQSAIWQEIASKHSSFGTGSRTQTMNDVYSKIDKELDNFSKEFKIEADQVGILVLISGVVIGLDYFLHKELLQENWEKIIEGYAIDALKQLIRDKKEKKCKAEEAKEKAKTFLKKLRETQSTRIKNPRKSRGDDLRFDSEDVTGSAVIMDEKALHMSAFQKTAWKDGLSSRASLRRRSRVQTPRQQRVIDLDQPVEDILDEEQE
ncbi:MAG: hypothetical protein GF308_07170 [Candidatus Heimdallarchaeota archaeon]|nr:hypothetical protein [Candidatus Heimdallarchaeota archaeon]